MHDVFLAHDPGPHVEQPARYAAVQTAVAQSGAEVVEAPPAPPEALERVHPPAYLEWLREVCAGGGGMLDPDTVVNSFSFDAAVRACGGAMAAVDAVLTGGADATFVGGRPPGPHAGPARAMGFCILNQVAVAAAHARARGLERVAIVDWDVHHGNGTQDVFWDDPSVLYVSLHQYGWGFFPGTGAASERGGDAAEGATLNLPMAVGTPPGDYLAAFAEHVLPAVRAHRPELVLVSAGYDAHRDDPLGSLRLDEAGFVDMTGRLADLGVPQVHVLEGGYDLHALGSCVGAVLGALGAPNPTQPVPGTGSPS
ncbi:MAG: histone deacetylase family protein [Gaiellales bacterium]